MKVFRLTDRIPLSIKIGEETIFFLVRPLSFDEKAKISSLAMIDSGLERRDSLAAVKMCLKHCLKDVKGIKNHDDTDYKLEFDDAGNLSDQCIDDLLNCEVSASLIMASFSLVQGISEHVVDPTNGKIIEGIKFHIKETKSLGKL